MIPKKEKAVALTTAKNNKHHSTPYRKTAPLSSQIQIGQLLFALAGNTADRQGWSLFERYLGGCYKGPVR